MSRILLAICATAAALYIGSFAWSFKTAHDQALQDDRDEVNQIIAEELFKISRGQ